jgi:pre-rRNA-processing protein TSR4
MRFLLQVYAPPPEEIESADAFHRTIFLFVSPRGDELHKPGTVVALRCQLPRRNPFYSFDPPTKSDDLPPPFSDEDPTTTSLGQMSQIRDPWHVAEAEDALRTSRSKPGSMVAKSTTSRSGKDLPMHLYPELELIVEPEGDLEDDDVEVKCAMQKYEATLAEEGELPEDELPSEVLDQVEANHSIERQHYALFQARIASSPAQCLRYCFSQAARPLCPRSKEAPSSSEIPPCDRCGGPRVFEFQVMPQLLNFLDLDNVDPHALDWGTIAVYSCQRSCAGASSYSDEDGLASAGSGNPHSAYVQEYVWVQES